VRRECGGPQTELVQRFWGRSSADGFTSRLPEAALAEAHKEPSFRARWGHHPTRGGRGINGCNWRMVGTFCAAGPRPKFRHGVGYRFLRYRSWSVDQRQWPRIRKNTSLPGQNSKEVGQKINPRCGQFLKRGKRQFDLFDPPPGLEVVWRAQSLGFSSGLPGLRASAQMIPGANNTAIVMGLPRPNQAVFVAQMVVGRSLIGIQFPTLGARRGAVQTRHSKPVFWAFVALRSAVQLWPSSGKVGFGGRQKIRVSNLDSKNTGIKNVGASWRVLEKKFES